MANKERTAVDAEHGGDPAEEVVANADESPEQEDEVQASDDAPGRVAEEPAGGGADEVAGEATETADSDSGHLLEEVARLKAEADQWQARYIRVLADLDNVRRRKNEEIASLKEYAAEEVLKRLLPVLDNLERAEAAAEKAVSEETIGLRDGVRLVLRQFRQVLQEQGVEAIESIGQPFDPNLHEAVLEVEATEEYPAGTVVEELQKGYRMRDRILRYSMVKVAVG